MTEAERSALVEAARRALGRAYAPYSGFAVGAALLTDTGATILGCNIENVAFSPTICAERAAVAGAVASGARKFQALAVVNAEGTTCAPCGTCRQVLFEFSPDAEVILENGEGGLLVHSVRELLPLAFGPQDLLSLDKRARHA